MHGFGGSVSISMKKYVEKAIMEFPDPLRNKPILTPATAKLFEVRPEVPKLNPAKKEKFHRIVAQLLYIMKRARPDLAPAVLLLKSECVILLMMTG